MQQICFKERSGAILDELITLRRDFHENPELSFQEFETAAKVAAFLKKLGIEVKEKVGGTGVTGILKGAFPGPTVGLRADMDALPIQELADVPFKSKRENVMHACGHDTHVACLLGAARLLSEVKGKLHGDVFFIFQPAEEKNQGARDMVKDGVMSDPKVDMIFGLHNHPEIPYGKVALKSGPLMASVDSIAVKITGKGGHGAFPHRDIDPIVAAAATIMNVQTIVSRNVEPLAPAVISFGMLKGGEANNVIPDFVEMTGTVRTYDKETQDLIEKRLKETVEASAATFGCTGSLNYIRSLPVVDNHPDAVKIAGEAIQKILGDGGAITPTPSMGGEDFAVFMEKAPGCFLWLGVGNPEIGAVHPWHSPLFKADERALSIGAGVLAQCVVEALCKLGDK